MTRWNASVVLADSESLAPETPIEQAIDGFQSPVVCVVLEDLEAEADDTVTIEFVGAAGTYVADERTLSEPESYTVAVPQCDAVQLTSVNGVTYSAEVRSDPR